MKILLISILGHHKIGLDLGVISMHSRFFYLRSRYRIRVAKISKIFLRGVGLLDILDTYEGERYMLVPSLRMKKNESTTYGKLKFHSSSLARGQKSLHKLSKSYHKDYHNNRGS